MAKKFFAKWRPTQQQIVAIVVVGLIVIATTFFVWRSTQLGVPDTGRIYLDEPTVSIKRGDEVSFTVRIDSPLLVDTVTATLQYDQSLLQYKETKYDSSVFSASIPAIIKDDVVTMQVAKLGGEAVRGDAPLAKIVFIARQDGTAKVTLSAGNAVYAGEYTHPRLEPKGAK